MQIAKVVDLSCFLVTVVFKPAVVTLYGRVIFFAEEYVLESRWTLNSASTVVLAQPNLTQIFLENSDTGVSQTWF